MCLRGSWIRYHIDRSYRLFSFILGFKSFISFQHRWGRLITSTPRIWRMSKLQCSLSHLQIKQWYVKIIPASYMLETVVLIKIKMWSLDIISIIHGISNFPLFRTSSRGSHGKCWNGKEIDREFSYWKSVVFHPVSLLSSSSLLVCSHPTAARVTLFKC